MVLRNIVGVLAGLVSGSLVNMGIITMSGQLISPPEGVDVTTMEGLRSAMHLLEPKHFLLPFLAHAFGTFCGALVASLVAGYRKMRWALWIGFLFLAGGVTNVILLPSPAWFAMVDICLAYIPFAYLGGRLGIRDISKA